jgi:nucleoside recognition membrane protein YjiH
MFVTTTTMTPAIGVLVLAAAILLTSPLAFAQSVGLTTEEQRQQNQIIETHQTAAQSLDAVTTTTTSFSSRWSEVTWIEPDDSTVIFVDCLPG